MTMYILFVVFATFWYMSDTSTVDGFLVPVAIRDGTFSGTQTSFIHQLRQTASSDLVEPSISPVEVPQDDVQQKMNGVNSESNMVQRLRQELIDLGERTDRGFKATKSDRERASKLIFDLAQYNTLLEPVWPYYGNKDSIGYDENSPSIKGKWTLIYTDAPGKSEMLSCGNE
jgi:PAP_fibrillin